MWLLLIPCFIFSYSINIRNDRRVKLNNLINDAEEDDIIELNRNTTYIVAPIEVKKQITIVGNGAEIRGTQPNTGISFYRNFQLEEVVFSGVWVSAKTKKVTEASIKKCIFIKQNFSNIAISHGASNVKITKCKFFGKAVGSKTQKGVFPCVQITTASRNILFANNICENVISGITADGITGLIDNIIVKNNYFEGLTYYALKVDVGNNYLFESNTVKSSIYGVFFVSTGENGKQSINSGKGMNIKNNNFLNVGSCLYVVGTQSKHELSFKENQMKNCTYAVRRSNMNLKITNNTFENGVSLYDNSETTTEGNIQILDNLICGAIKKVKEKPDWDKKEIQGALVFAPVARSNAGNIVIKGNVFKNIKGRILNVPRIGWTAKKYIKIEMEDNKFINAKGAYIGAGEIQIDDKGTFDDLILNEKRSSMKIKKSIN